MLRDVVYGLTDLLYPPECPGCGNRMSGRFVCETCRSSFQDATSVTLSADLPSGVLPVIALWNFREHDPIQKILHRLKYANSPWIGADIGLILGDKLQSTLSWRPDVIIPVPLHDSRRLHRGYNQSEWIARGVAQYVGSPVAPDLVTRVRETRSQTTLTRNERFANVEGSFRVRGGSLTGQRVTLIDDTVTTGATLMSCAEALQRAGAALVAPAAAAAAPLRAVLEPVRGFPVIPT